MFGDMIINANMAYIHKGNIVRKRELTIIKYLKTYFFIDLVNLLLIDFSFYWTLFIKN